MSWSIRVLRLNGSKVYDDLDRRVKERVKKIGEEMRS